MSGQTAGPKTSLPRGIAEASLMRRRAPRRKRRKKQPGCDGGAAQADKADTLSAWREFCFIIYFMSLNRFSPSGRTGEQGLVSRRKHRTTSQAGHNDGKEPGRNGNSEARSRKRMAKRPLSLTSSQNLPFG